MLFRSGISHGEIFTRQTILSTPLASLGLPCVARVARFARRATCTSFSAETTHPSRTPQTGRHAASARASIAPEAAIATSAATAAISTGPIDQRWRIFPSHRASRPARRAVGAYTARTSSNCQQCHGATAGSYAIPRIGFAVVGMPANHIPTTASCEVCHVVTDGLLPAAPAQLVDERADDPLTGRPSGCSRTTRSAARPGRRRIRSTIMCRIH